MAARDPFGLHTEIVEEVQQKMFYLLGDLGFTASSAGKVAMPRSPGALLRMLAGAKALSATGRQGLGQAVDVLPMVLEARKKMSPDARRESDVIGAILYSVRSRNDLDRGLDLIAELFQTTTATETVVAVRDLVTSGTGRIYGPGTDVLLESSKTGQSQIVAKSVKEILKIDAGAAAGAIAGGIRDARVIALAATGASAAASAEAVLDQIFPEQVPLFPKGGNGPYNPIPNPNP
ncbi:hypothetical protein [Cryobacterium arcticum]|uniref:hypothetical protein n=1 Tax=Cryobacterium arcticum TaxID=670052 RepID=UPI0012ECEEAB|nr:hypothetical protein [Cryobacterium arcticum]